MSVTKNGISVTDNIQIKEKKRKENKSKENNPPLTPPQGVMIER